MLAKGSAEVSAEGSAEVSAEAVPGAGPLGGRGPLPEELLGCLIPRLEVLAGTQCQPELMVWVPGLM